MKKQFTKTLATLLLGITVVGNAVASEKIDRRKVVTRHNIHSQIPMGMSPRMHCQTTISIAVIPNTTLYKLNNLKEHARQSII